MMGNLLEYLKARSKERDAVVDYLVSLSDRFGPFSERGMFVKAIALDITRGDHVLSQAKQEQPGPPEPTPPAAAGSRCRCGLLLEPGETECGTCPRTGPRPQTAAPGTCSCGNELKPGEKECGPCQGEGGAR